MGGTRKRTWAPRWHVWGENRDMASWQCGFAGRVWQLQEATCRGCGGIITKAYLEQCGVHVPEGRPIDALTHHLISVVFEGTVASLGGRAIRERESMQGCKAGRGAEPG